MKALPFDVVAAFLRLGQKYYIEVLKTEATSRLTHEFPSSLDAWDSLVENSMIEQDGCLYVDAINLARETGCLALILPMTFYNLFSSQPIHKILAQGDRLDGSKGSLLFDEHLKVVSWWAQCVEEQKELTFRWLYASNTYTTCTRARSCSDERFADAHENFLPIPRVFGLESWATWSQDFEMCLNCTATAKDIHEQGRREFWAKLPGLVGLPGWDQLVSTGES